MHWRSALIGAGSAVLLLPVAWLLWQSLPYWALGMAIAVCGADAMGMGESAAR